MSAEGLRGEAVSNTLRHAAAAADRGWQGSAATTTAAAIAVAMPQPPPSAVAGGEWQDYLSTSTAAAGAMSQQLPPLAAAAAGGSTNSGIMTRPLGLGVSATVLGGGREMDDVAVAVPSQALMLSRGSSGDEARGLMEEILLRGDHHQQQMLWAVGAAGSNGTRCGGVTEAGYDKRQMQLGNGIYDTQEQLQQERQHRQQQRQLEQQWQRQQQQQHQQERYGGQLMRGQVREEEEEEVGTSVAQQTQLRMLQRQREQELRAR
jgi:hypothetical protein